jgi:hypothetical protein
LLGDGIKYFRRAHCSFVRSIPSICNIFKQMSRIIFEIASNNISRKKFALWNLLNLICVN